jgi:hypothetical protein
MSVGVGKLPGKTQTCPKLIYGGGPHGELHEGSRVLNKEGYVGDAGASIESAQRHGNDYAVTCL